MKDEIVVDTKLEPEEGIKTKNKGKSNPSTCEIFWYIFLTLILFMAVVFLFFLMRIGGKKVRMLVAEKDMIQSSVDNRKYRVIKLENNIDVILINDQSNTKSAASLTIGTGSFQDPEEAPGIAHLTEHLIMTGSHYYPRPSIFEDYLSVNFGSTNSFTEEEKTTFYFEVYWEGFDKALKMFSKMFAEPLLDEDLIKTQLEIMYSEFEKNKHADQWKEHQIIKSMGNPVHPFNRLSIGDVEKLKKIEPSYLAHLVRAFYNKYYTPHNMKLVLSSSMNIEQLEGIANYYFSDIRIDSVKAGQTDRYGEIKNNAKAYTFKELAHIVWYQKKPSHLTPTLDLIFVLDSILSKENIEIKPLDYITYLIKYSGKGSLIEYLKKKNLAVKVELGIIASFKTFSQYAISIYLTEKGLNNINKVLEISFAYINKFRKNTETYVDIKYYKEIQKIAENNFKFLMKDDPSFIENINKNLNSKMSDYLTSLSINMFDYSHNEYVRSEFLYKNYNSTVITKFINSFIPENVLIIIGSYQLPETAKDLVIKQNSGTTPLKKEKYFNTLYSKKKINKDLMEKLLNSKKDFFVRPTNIFISQALNLVSCWGSGDNLEIEKAYEKNNHNATIKNSCNKEQKDIAPKLVLNSEKLKIWYKMDRTFLSPKTNIYINIITKDLRGNITKYANLNIFFEFLKYSVEIKLSDAIDAGNEIKLEMNENGIIIKIDSYSDMVSKIIEKLIALLFDNNFLKKNFTKRDFDNMVEICVDRLKNIINKSPGDKLRQIFATIIKRRAFSIEDVIYRLRDEKEALTYETFIKEIFSIQNGFYINSMFYGYITESQIKDIKKLFMPFVSTKKKKEEENQRNLQLFKLIDNLHTHNLLDGSFIYKRYENSTTTEGKLNCIGNFYQIGKRSVKKALLMRLVEFTWGNLFKYKIRVVKKLGNILTADTLTIDNILYFLFLVQTKHSPNDLNLELDKIISAVFERIDKMETKKLELYKDALMKELTKPYSNLKEKSSSAWLEVYEDSLEFQMRKSMQYELSKITVHDLLEFFSEYFIGQPKKLSIRLYTDTNKPKIQSSEEPYGYLNNQLKSFVFTKTDFLAEAKGIHRNVAGTLNKEKFQKNN